MNKKLVLLLAAIFLTGAVGVDIPAMAVSRSLTHNPI